MEKRIYGLLGRKLGHSYSVPIHCELGNPDYQLIELEPRDLAAFLAREDLGGLNVTIPYKLSVMEFCDFLSPEAKAIGAVNTIVNRDGKLWGYNTDQYGFCYMLQKADIDLCGKKVLVLGSGGASRMACYCARKLGAASVTVISRSGEDHYGNLEKHADAQILINTTPVGMYPENGAAPVSLKAFPQCSGVVDLIYNPLRTQLVMEAEALGIRCIGGLVMLTAQAKAAEELFFDKVIADDCTDKITDKIMHEYENIVLIGMPGSGKSTIGKALALRTGRKVLEIDDLVAEAAAKSIPQIFADSGEEAFRALEHRIICQAGASSGTILVTGGGAVTRKENYFPLHQNGRIYEVVRDTELLATEGRPLSTDLAALRAMYEKRRPMYQAFQDVRIVNSTSADSTADEIWRDFCENTHY